MIELVSKIECARDLRHAQDTLCEEMVRKLDCQSVAYASFTKGKLKLETISGVNKLDRTSDTFKLFVLEYIPIIYIFLV